jgi:trans-aconitate methyltransferase
MTPAADDRWLTGDAYEAYMGRWSRPLATEFVRWLRPMPSANWLEIGCGTGALTAAVCGHAEPVSIVACDASPSFIEHARRNIATAQASFVAASVDQMPRREGGFDVIVSGLVFNFLPSPGAAAASMRDRLRRGGVLAAYVWDYAEGMEFLRFFWEEAVALDARASESDERSRFTLCSEAALASLFRDTGLMQVETGALEIPTDFASFDDYWTPFLRGTGPAPSYVASLEPTQRGVLRERLRERLQPHTDGPIRLRARSWVVRGASD